MKNQLISLIKLSHQYLETSKNLETNNTTKQIETIHKLAKKAYSKNFAVATVQREQGQADYTDPAKLHQDIRNVANDIQNTIKSIYGATEDSKEIATKVVTTAFNIDNTTISKELQTNAWIDFFQDKIWGFAKKEFKLDILLEVVAVVESNQEKQRMIAEINAKKANLQSKHAAILKGLEEFEQVLISAKELKEYYESLSETILTSKASNNAKSTALLELYTTLNNKYSKMSDQQLNIVKNLDKDILGPLLIRQVSKRCSITQHYQQWAVLKNESQYNYARKQISSYALNKNKLTKTIFEIKSTNAEAVKVKEELQRLNILPKRPNIETNILRKVFPSIGILESPDPNLKSIHITQEDYATAISNKGAIPLP